jgi:response regulator RpfG family c-di-GMP phosphodiesterase
MLKKLLILDDDLDTLELLKRVLRKHFDVYTFNDSIQLFLHLSYSDAHMILMDHMVGNEFSTEIVNKLNFLQKAQGLKKIPIILHSGHEQINLIAKSLSVEGFIQKPCSIIDLRNYLLNHLTNSEVTNKTYSAGI